MEVRWFRSGSEPGWSRPGALVVKALLGLAYVILASQTPVAVLTMTGHDDGLFWNRAMQMVDGHWLGTYDQLTLAKGPAYSIFLALNHYAGTSVLVSMALLHLLACWVVTHEVERLGLPRWGAVATFAAILFHPALVPTRVIRDDIYAPLALLALAGALRAYRGGHRRWGTAGVTVSGGLALGFLWVTREEGVWVVPGLALLALLAVLQVRRTRAGLLRLGGRTVLYAVPAVAVVAGVMTANAVVYDEAVVADVTGSAFADAMTALTSVEAGPVVPRVPVTEEMREAAYEVSPTAAELAPILEAPDNRWRGIGCPGGCDDFGGGWWMWALRDAVAEAGHYRDAPSANAYYERLATEVQDACDAGRLRCRHSSIPLIPPLTEEQWHQLPGRALAAAGLLAMREGTVLGTDASREPLPVLDDIRSFLGDPPTTLAPSEGRLIVAGWFHDAQGGWLDLRCRSGGEVRTVPVERLDSADVAAVVGPTADRARFHLDLDPGARCLLTPTSGDAADGVALSDLVQQGPGGRLLGAATLQVESASAARADVPPTWARAVVDRLAVAYAWVVPLVLAGGLLGVVVGLVRLARGGRSHVPLLTLALVAWALVATRCAVLILVDLTSFDAVHAGYMTAGFPLALLAAAAGLGCFVVPDRPGHDHEEGEDRPDTVTA